MHSNNLKHNSEHTMTKQTTAGGETRRKEAHKLSFLEWPELARDEATPGKKVQPIERERSAHREMCTAAAPRAVRTAAESK